jgi:hypothetical protein
MSPVLRSTQVKAELAMQATRASLFSMLALAATLVSAGEKPAQCRGDSDSAGSCDKAPVARSQMAVSAAFLWTANDANYGVGTVSKVATQPFAFGTKYHEAARYASVTCQSDPVNGSKEGARFSTTPPSTLCADGTHGCCSRAETVPGANGLHQPINLVQNRPIRTAVDVGGSTWVVNAANGDISRQSSVTRIAGSISECVERNGLPGIQTSTDANGDGIIDTDCNNNGTADDAADINGLPCQIGHPQEFWGLDDECVLFTVNIGAAGDVARSLALGKGASAAAPSDAWVGTYNDGKFYRIDAVTGAIKNTIIIGPQAAMVSHPFGAVIDQFGILWAENVAGDGNCPGGCVFYFDTANTANQDAVAPPGNIAGGGFHGIALDGYRGASGLLQQIWFGAYNGYGAYRYRPVRNAGFAAIGTGTWALGQVTGPGQLAAARGVAVDNRTPAFAWVAIDGGGVAKIPANMPDGSNTFAPATNLFLTGQNATLGTGVTADQDIWAANGGSSTLTHFSVDAAGNVNNSGSLDQFNLDDKPGAIESFCPIPMYGLCKPHPDTNSDFTGFAFVTFTYPGIDRIFADGFE